jgi:hypothetical protein
LSKTAVGLTSDIFSGAEQTLGPAASKATRPSGSDFARKFCCHV